MPELREVFEMTTKQMGEPDVDSWREQKKRQRKASRNKKIGAISLSAALAVAVALLVVNTWVLTDQGRETNVAGQPATLPSEPGAYLFDLETQQATRVSGISWDAVSPDGTMVAYEGTDPEGRNVIYVANVDGTNVRALEKTAATGPEPVGPQFSPDGSQIAFQAKDYGNLVGDIFLVDVATGQTTRLTHLKPVSSGLWDMGPTFSPDGQTVFFTRPTGDQSWGLWSVAASGGRPTLVLRDAIGGRLSPDGRTILYFRSKPSSDDPFLGDMWLANADGTDARRLAVRGDVFSARWSPDGTKISYFALGRGTYVVDVTTGEITKVLEDAFPDSWPEWVDDHTWIVVVD
jgi:Tol biopolymer transport system component